MRHPTINHWKFIPRIKASGHTFPEFVRALRTDTPTAVNLCYDLPAYPRYLIEQADQVVGDWEREKYLEQQRRNRGRSSKARARKT